MTHLLLDAILQSLQLITDLVALLLDVALGIADLRELVQDLLSPLLGWPTFAASELVLDGVLISSLERGLVRWANPDVQSVLTSRVCRTSISALILFCSASYTALSGLPVP